MIKDLLDGVVKLKFGDREQIECIDSYGKAQEEAEEGLRRYRVICHYSGSSSVDVDAYDEEDAKEKAQDEIDDHEIEWEDIEHTEVDLVKEPENAKNQD